MDLKVGVVYCLNKVIRICVWIFPVNDKVNIPEEVFNDSSEVVLPVQLIVGEGLLPHLHSYPDFHIQESVL